MSSPNPVEPVPPPDAARLRTATAILEALVEDRGLLAQLSPEERTRLLQAAGQVFCPDTADRRRLTRATQRQRKAEKQSKDEAVLEETGIR